MGERYTTRDGPSSRANYFLPKPAPPAPSLHPPHPAPGLVRLPQLGGGALACDFLLVREVANAPQLLEPLPRLFPLRPVNRDVQQVQVVRGPRPGVPVLDGVRQEIGKL